MKKSAWVFIKSVNGDRWNVKIGNSSVTEVYSEPCQISKMELYAQIVNGFQPLTIIEKSSILDVWQGSE